LQHTLQPRQASIEIVHYIHVGEPERPEAKLPQHLCITCNIGLGIMRISIDFDHQTARWTEEIDNAPANHVLATELVPVELATAQRNPQTSFGFGGIVAHRASAGLERI
jgi:hypothetical protein